MPLQATSGAASYDGFGGGTAAKVNYIEDFFQSYLRTGTGASATVTTGLDGSTKETLVWTKSRSAATNHKLTDNVRGATKALSSNTTGAEATDSQGLTAFSATGYTIGTNTDYNNSGATYVDWQWVAQPKFFDIVTYTGTNGVQTINHNLGSVPGVIIVKSTSTASQWNVYHRSLGATQAIKLQSTAAATSSVNFWNDTNPTSTQFTLGASFNTLGETYVAYIFAHDAGGFGLSGTDNVISCGSFTTDGSGLATVSLGYEPQWVLFKQTDGVDSWYLNDIMRGMSVSASSNNLSPNLSAAESAGGYDTKPTATGFNANSGIANKNYIYIAIRRGPMKVPTTGTSVFAPTTYTGTGTARSVTGLGFPPDVVMLDSKSFANNFTYDKLRGPNIRLFTNDTAAETNDANRLTAFNQDGYSLGTLNPNESGVGYANWNFRRAPSFMDVVCYTGTGSARTVSHNLAAVPEMMIVKCRGDTGQWAVYSSNLTASNYLFLNSTAASATNTAIWNATAPTSSVFSVGTSVNTNSSGFTFVAYLFATCAGVSKVFSYTGNGSSQTINCGFTGGARFVLIKRTDSTGDWYVWDTARGIVAGNDPHLSLNTTTAEVTTDDTIDTDNTGFVVNQVTATNVNVSSATYIGLAVA